MIAARGIHLEHEKTIVDVLRRRVEEQASQRLYTWLDDDGSEVENWTFSDLDIRARTVAAQLQRIGAAGEKALLLYPPGLEFIAAFFGCLYTGIIAVPGNMPRHRRTDVRLRSIVQDSQPDLLVTTSAHLARKANYIDRNPELGQLRWLATDEPALSTVEWRFPAVKADDIAFLQYTSGSTADPKGVIVTHENLLANQAMIADHYSIKLSNVKASTSLADTIYVSWLPLFHDLGLLGPVLSAVYLGCRSINLAPVAFLQKPFRWFEAISRYKGTCIAAPNFAYDLCVQKTKPEERERLDLSSLDAALNAAEPVRVETLERFTKAFESCGFRSRMFTPCYGLAEATLIVAANVDNYQLHVNRLALTEGEAVPVSPDDPDAWELTSCGATGPEMGIYVVDPDTHVQCDPGRVGEIWVEGPHISPGYWNKPEQTKSAFQATMSDSGAGPYLRTGDLGFILNGRLFITGRLKELIIIRGKNHFPQDIELTVQTSHPALHPGSGAAFGFDTGSEEVLIVAQEVTRSARKDLNVDEISAAVRLAVAQEHGVTPDGLLLVKPLGIPKTSSGKIRRLATRDAFLDSTLKILDQWFSARLKKEDSPPKEGLLSEAVPFVLSDDSEVNATQLQNWIYWRFSQIPELKGKDLDLARPFAGYGLDSLVSVQLVNELAEWSGYPIELAKLWQLPTIEELIQYLASDLVRQMATKAKGKSASTSTHRIDGKEAERLLERIDDLSEAEIDQLLAEMDDEDSGLD